MNITLLRTLRKAVAPLGFTDDITSAYIRSLLLEHFFKGSQYAQDVPSAFGSIIRPLLQNLSSKPEGTPHALTPEILSLLRESSSQTRKQNGVFYTPWELGSLLAKEILDAWGRVRGPLTSHQLRALKIIDPSAGTGGLLLPFAVELAKRICTQTRAPYKKELRRVLSKQLYAADICTEALDDYAVRAQLLTDARAPLTLHTVATDALQIYQGKICFRKHFPEVFKNGGFDLVLSNPPYVGQKHHATLFTHLRNHSFWGSYITPKSDLMYLFFYLSLFLLKPNGMAGFITPPYFTTAAGAKVLRHDLKEQVSFLRLLNFEEKNLFPGTHQHTLLSVFLKEKTSHPCLIGPHSTPLSQTCVQNKQNDFIRTQLPSIENASLFRILNKMKKQPYTLSQVAHISNGLMTGCDKISAAHLRKFKLPGIKKGTGVFVLSNEEKHTLSLNKYEQKKIKPFFKNSAIAPYYIPSIPSHWLIDFFYPNDRDLDLSRYPHLLSHLSRFKSVLLARRQNNNGIQHQLAAGNYWFGSVRRKMNFEGEKLVVPHRAERPCFAYSNGPWYASSDVYFVSRPQKDFSLEALLALLNSPAYHLWLYYNGKRKGKLLELYAQPLNELPLPKISYSVQQRLASLSREIMRKKATNPAANTALLEQKVAHLSAHLFHLTPSEEKALAQWKLRQNNA